MRTPRITAGATLTSAGLTDVVIGAARPYDGAPELTEHPSLYAARIAPGTALTTTTYAGTADNVVVNGHPEVTAIALPWSEITDLLWQSLQPSLRVAAITVRLDTSTFTEAARARTP